MRYAYHNETLQDLILDAAKKYADRPAFWCMGASFSYSDFLIHAQHFSNYCREILKLKKGDRLAVMLPNLLSYPIAIFGAILAGLVVVNINPMDKAENLQHELSDSGAKAIVILENVAHELEKVIADTQLEHVMIASVGGMQPFLKRLLINGYLHWIKSAIPAYSLKNTVWFREVLKEGAILPFQRVALESQDLAFIQYTGGTTGIAKGVMLTHQNLMSNLFQVRVWVNHYLKEGEEIILTALPLYHIFSLLVNCFLFIKLGGKNILVPDPRNLPDLVKVMHKTQYTCLTGVNTLFNALLHNPAFRAMDHSRIKMAIGGGMAVQKPIADAWQALTHSVIIEGYGLTEASPVVTINSPTTQHFTGSIGLPIAATELSIQDKKGHLLPPQQVGELCIKGPQVMEGYYGRPEETKKALKQGWLHTADAAYVDERGFYFIVDRLKDMVIVSGFNVYPAEVEKTLKTLPGVNEVAVIGIPDEVHGEVVKAFIVTEKGITLSAKQVIDFTHQHLASYKCPHQVEFLNALPKSAVGKILKKELKNMKMLPGFGILKEM